MKNEMLKFYCIYFYLLSIFICYLFIYYVEFCNCIAFNCLSMYDLCSHEKEKEQERKSNIKLLIIKKKLQQSDVYAVLYQHQFAIGALLNINPVSVCTVLHRPDEVTTSKYRSACCKVCLLVNVRTLSNVEVWRLYCYMLKCVDFRKHNSEYKVCTARFVWRVENLMSLYIQ